MISDTFNLEKQRLGIKKIIETCVARIAAESLEVHGALLDARGDLIDAIGPNPLHYPGLESTVKAAKLYLTPKNGETLITNDPSSGNPRLCDLVLIQGGYGRQQANELRFYVVLQVSLPQLLNKNEDRLFSSVEDEGYRIPPTPLEQGTGLNNEIINYLCQSKIEPQTLTSILNKIRNSLKIAAQEIISLEGKMGREPFTRGLEDLKTYSEKLMRKALHDIPDGEYSGSEIIESDGFGARGLRIQCHLTVQGENILVSFVGTAKQTKGPYNCNYTMTLGACFWVFRSLVKRDLPINAGAFKAFSVEAPEGTLVNAKYPAPLLGGYFETSKRIVDTLFVILNKALPTEIPAQNGSSSNVCLIKTNETLLVEVLGTGGGATKNQVGASTVLTELHNFQTNSIEMIELNLPLQITHSGPRASSGGEGKFSGGDGLTRGYKFLSDAQVTLLGDRRTYKARGLFGGGSGLPSEIILIQNGDRKKTLEEKAVIQVKSGDVLVINTPGGGGWGKKAEPEPIQ